MSSVWFMRNDSRKFFSNSKQTVCLHRLSELQLPWGLCTHGRCSESGEDFQGQVEERERNVLQEAVAVDSFFSLTVAKIGLKTRPVVRCTWVGRC